VVGDVLDLRGRGEEVVEPLLDGRVLNPRLVLPDDVDLLPGVAPELLLGEVAGSLGLRARRVVVGVVLAGDGGAMPIVATSATIQAMTTRPRRR